MAVSLARPGFTFAEVVDVIATMYQVHEDRRDTLVSRIQQLQKMGIPANNVGKGSKVRYLNWQIADLSVSFELLNCGITPAVLKEYFRPLDRNYLGVYSFGGVGWHVQSSLDGDGADQYHLFRFNTLRYLSDARSAEPSDMSHGLDRVDYGRSSENVLEELDRAPALAINLTDHLRRLRKAVESGCPGRLEDVTFYPTRSGLREGG
jgi:hypothetical protein